MKDKDLVRTYVNNFRRHLTSHLLPGVSIKTTGVLAKAGGGIVKVAFSKGSENSDEILRSVETFGDAIKTVGIKAFGDAQGMAFSGTNVVMEGNSIFLIKGQEKELWSDSSAKEDVSKILHSPRSSKN